MDGGREGLFRFVLFSESFLRLRTGTDEREGRESARA